MTHITKSLFACLLLTVACIAGNAREQESIGRKQLFDNSWKFSLGDMPTASGNNFDDSRWRKLDLPHDWSIEGKLEQNNPMKVRADTSRPEQVGIGRNSISRQHGKENVFPFILKVFI